MSFGFVKNGGLSAEVLIFFDDSLADATRRRRKRAGHLLSKGRYLAAQILTVDHLSAGRVSVGLGSGGPPHPYVAFGHADWPTRERVERLARQVFHADLAHTVLAVPIAQERATMHLDTVCTMVDADKIVVTAGVGLAQLRAQPDLAWRCYAGALLTAAIGGED